MNPALNMYERVNIIFCFLLTSTQKYASTDGAHAKRDESKKNGKNGKYTKKKKTTHKQQQQQLKNK